MKIRKQDNKTLRFVLVVTLDGEKPGDHVVSEEKDAMSTFWYLWFGDL